MARSQGVGGRVRQAVERAGNRVVPGRRRSPSPVGSPTAAARTAKKAVTTTSATKKAPAKNAPAKKAPAKKAAPAKHAPAKKAPAKAAPAKQAPAKKAPAKQAPAKAAPAKQAPAKAAPAKKAPAKKAASRLVVRVDESPWTTAELAEVKGQLQSDVRRLREEIARAEAELNELLRDSGEGSGDDQADAGSKTFEREHEMSMANNARDLLLQIEHALARIANGSYGMCESCGQPIGKARLQAFPRATLCVSCKQREERR